MNGKVGKGGGQKDKVTEKKDDFSNMLEELKK